MERARYYLERSHKLLIDILVDTCALDEHVPGVTLFRQEFMPIFHIVIPYIHRWKSLSLKVRDRECKLGARNALSSCGSAPHLEYLQLWHIEDWDSAERLYTQIGPPPVIVFNKSLPALKHIVLIGVNVPWTHSPFLEELETVELALHSDEVRIPYDVWSHMLASSPGLRRLSLHYSGPRASTGDWPGDVINLPGLHELKLTDLDPPYILQVLQRLSMPNVTHLQVELYDREQDFSEFFEYLAEPPAPPATEAEAAEGAAETEVEENAPTPPRPPFFPSLEKLTITALDCTPESFTKFLRSSTVVRQLEISCAKMTDGVFQELWSDRGRDAGPSDLQGKGQDGELADPSAEPVHDSSTAAGPSSARQNPRHSTRASSSDSARTELSVDADTLSTAPTSPLSITAPLEAAQPSQSREGVLLPELDTIRVSGAESHELCAFIRYRQRVGHPVRSWFIDDRIRSEELKHLEAQMIQAGGYEQIHWFEPAEDEDEEVDDEEYDEEGSYASGEEDDEDPVADAGAAATEAPQEPGDLVDEIEEYDEDDDYSDEDS